MNKKVNPLKRVLDKARDLCGSQALLAAKLGMPATHLSNVKAGTRGLSNEQVKKLASLLEENAADLWLLAQERKNPFRTSENSTLKSLVIGFLVSILSCVFNDRAEALSQVPSTTYDVKSPKVERVSSLYIVAHLGRWLYSLLSVPYHRKVAIFGAPQRLAW